MAEIEQTKPYRPNGEVRPGSSDATDPWAAFPLADAVDNIRPADDPWRDFPIVQPAGNDPWASFPMAGGASQPPVTPAAPATPNYVQAGRGGVEAPAPAQTQPAPQPDDGLLSALGTGALDIGASAASGFRQGISNLMGLPVDAANWTLSKVPVVGGYLSSETPVGGAASIDKALRYGGAVPTYEPQTGVGRFADRAMQDVGAAAVPVVAGGALARSLGAEGVRALESFSATHPETWGPGIAKNLAAPMAAAPARTAAKELAVGAGAGAGAATANEIKPDSWVAELLGGIGGASAVGIGRNVAGNIGNIWRAVSGSPKYTSRVVEENAADTLASNSDMVARQSVDAPLGTGMNTDPLVAALREPAPVESVVPGFRATAANRTGDAGLGALEAARTRGPNQGRFTDAAAANSTAVERAVGEVAPTQPSAALSDAMQAERSRRLSEADALAQMFGQEADRAAAPFGINTTRAERGGAIREDLTAARDAARGQTDAAYDNLRNSTGFAGAQGSGDALRAAVANAKGTLTETRKGLLPEVTIDRVLNSLDEGAPVSLTEVVDLDSELSRLQRAALADPRAEKGGRNAAEAIGRVRTALDDYLQGAMTPEQRDALASAKQAKLNEADAFARPGSPIASALAEGEGGRPKMRDDRVASTFSDPQNIDELFARATTPQTREAVKQEILSRGDFSSSKGAEQFMQDYGEQMKRFPGLEAEVRTAASKRAAAEGAQASAEQIAKDIGENGTSAVAKYLRYGDETAARAMRQVLRNNPRPADTMDEILSFVGNDPHAIQGARRAFWDVMEQEGRNQNLATMSADGTMAWAPKKWKAFLDDRGVAAAAERLYRDDPEQLQRIRDIATTLRQAGVQPAQRTAANPSGTALMHRNKTLTLAEVQAKGYEVARRRVNPIYMVTYLAGRLANRAVAKQAAQAYEMALDKALIDPEYAAKLLSENNPANRAALRQMSKGWMGNELSNAMASDLATKDSDPTIDALQ
ncbi:hypothetical protein [Thioclava nitratireducens]|uniref:hypothetical protein n=1 Tax=Thioclava nitratireducens TaxID=1915078 RepID=UPI0024804B83|nr:hypothetical protein [Thioclava nitratireducens]WGT48909.1 hypothetical protein P0N61_11280 [Thioclava nitratireducens]